MHLWHREATEWARIPIDDGVRVGCGDDGHVVFGDAVARNAANVVTFVEHGKPCAVLVTDRDAAVTLNGFSPLGLAMLEDRDEIRVFDARGMTAGVLIFGARESVKPVVFTERSEPDCCARCRQQLHGGDVVVRCYCGSWYHNGVLAPRQGGGDGAASTRERYCWDYDPKCSSCQRLRGEMVWSPSMLGDDAGADDDDMPQGGEGERS